MEHETNRREMRAGRDGAVEVEQRKVLAAQAPVAEVTRVWDLPRQRVRVRDVDVSSLTEKGEGGGRVAGDAGIVQKMAETESEQLREDVATKT